jgi:hypothetical protein
LPASGAAQTSQFLIDARKLTYNYLGLDQRIIGPAGEARVHHELIA